MIFPNQAECRHPLRVDRLISSQVVLVVKNLPASAETQEMGVQSLGREDSPGDGNGNPLQYSCLENPMDSGA